MKPSELWEDSESALRGVCSGCQRETGWLDDPCGIDTPDCALRVVDDRDVLTAYGACAERAEIVMGEVRKAFERSKEAVS